MRIILLNKKQTLIEGYPCILTNLTEDFYKPIINSLLDETTRKESLTKLEEEFGLELLFFVEDGTLLPNRVEMLPDEMQVRESTMKELVNRNLYPLASNEYLIDDNTIGTFDTSKYYLENGELIEITREYLIETNQITIESERTKARSERDRVFKGLDLYDKAVLRGDVEESFDHKRLRDQYRQYWLDLPSSYVDITYPIEDLYPEVPFTEMEYFIN